MKTNSNKSIRLAEARASRTAKRKGDSRAAHGSAKIPLWLVMGRNNKDEPWHPCAAYGTKIQAEVYASGCSDKDRMKIVAGLFSPNDRTELPPPNNPKP